MPAPPPALSRARRAARAERCDRQHGCCCLKDALQHQALAKLGKRKASRKAAPAAPAPARYVFLDIDGVLLPFGEGAPACAADGDPARSFPRHCLAALARLLEARSPPQSEP